MPLRYALVAGALCFAPQSRPDDGPSLETLLRLSRERTQQLRASAGDRIRSRLAMLSIPYDANATAVDQTIQEILKFGDLSTAPLADTLSGPEGHPLAANAARALAASKETNVVAELERVLANGTTPERARIAWVLARHDEPRSRELLRSLFNDPEPAVAGQAALGLARLKATDAAPAIADRLKGASAPLARDLLAALGQLGDAKIGPAVAAFLESPLASESAESLPDLLRVIRSHELLAPATRVAANPQIPAETSVRILHTIAEQVSSADREAVVQLKKVLDEGASYEVKEEAAFALAAAKEPAGATWLLKQPNEALRETPDSPALLRRRAKILLRLKRYREAVRDFDEYRRHLSKRNPIEGDVWIEIARAQAGNKTFSPAADALRQAVAAGIRPKSFRDFEEFADMRKQSRYAAIFEAGGE